MLRNYFKPDEFSCKCSDLECSGKDVGRISPELVRRLNKLRLMLGRPVVITSALRCAAHNAASGGKPDSAHLTGEAADIRCGSSVDRYHVLVAALVLFQRVGIHREFIHVDCDERKPQDVVWMY